MILPRLIAPFLMGLLVLSAGTAQDRGRRSPRPTPRVDVERRSVVIGSGDSYLGVNLEEVDAAAVTKLSLPGEFGARIAQVADSSPAAQAGLTVNDVVVGWNGERVEGVRQLQRLIRETPAGRTVALDVIRGGSTMKISARVEERRESLAGIFGGPGGDVKLDSAFTARMHILGGRLDSLSGILSDSATWRRYLLEVPGDLNMNVLVNRRGRLGVELQGLTPQLARYFGVASGKGALISAVRDSSAAERAGLRAGDVIIAVGGKTVESTGDASRLLRERDAGPVEVTIVRDGHEQTIQAQLEKKAPEPEGLFRSMPHGFPFGRFNVPNDGSFQFFDFQDIPDAPGAQDAPEPLEPPELPFGDTEFS